ncbi:MAG: peptidoglycan-binding domain-containing protein [Minisyncoccia bacterium]
MRYLLAFCFSLTLFVLAPSAEAQVLPFIDPHVDIVAEATSTQGVAVPFAVLAHDEIDGDVPAVCSPESNTKFPLNAVTPVTCTYINSNTIEATPVLFTVQVVDTTPPLVGPHGDKTQEATGMFTEVKYGAPNAFDPGGFRIDGARPADCTPADGSLFLIGTTTITCTATDSANNQAVPTMFNVIVTPPAVIPDGFCGEGNHFDTELATCVPDAPPPPPPPPAVVDVCGNIKGVQETVPPGMQSVDGDQCVTTEQNRSRSGGKSGSEGGGGAVLGASTCSPLLSEYLRLGGTNTSDEVLELQEFLGENLTIALPVTGVFDEATDSAVKQFQSKYWILVLKPWGTAGAEDTYSPTGYVYRFTRWLINNLSCPGSELYPSVFP